LAHGLPLQTPKMLKITTTQTEDRQKLVLHGQLAGPWVAELQAAWDKSLSVVDLTDVTFVDEAGAQVLCAMKNAGVRFLARGVDTKYLLDDLKRKTTPPLRRCLSWLAKDACQKD
jgi:ABC-type transporter Mla MlaB component